MKLIGIDVGGTKCSVVTGDENGNVFTKTVIKTAGCEETLCRIYEAVREAGEADYTGISCGGPLDEKNGIILSPPNLPGWDGIRICDKIREITGTGCAIKNDADACAVAEWLGGAGKGCDNMVFLTFGTGMGAGLILNGAPYSGTGGNAGEAGHIRLARTGPVGYRKKGSFEGFCSGGGIRQMGQREAEKLFALGKPGPAYCPDPSDLPSVNAKTVAEAARKGDPCAQRIFRRSASYLGAGISVLIDLLEPQAVVIGGIYPRCRDLLEEGMLGTIKKEALPQSAKNCRVLPSYYGESIGDKAALFVASYAAEKSKNGRQTGTGVL